MLCPDLDTLYDEVRRIERIKKLANEERHKGQSLHGVFLFQTIDKQ